MEHHEFLLESTKKALKGGITIISTIINKFYPCHVMLKGLSHDHGLVDCHMIMQPSF